MKIDKYTMEVHDHCSLGMRRHSFWINKSKTHDHSSQIGHGGFPVFIDEQLDVKSGERFQVERERVGDDEVVIRVKRLKPNKKNKPEINPFSCRVVCKTKLRKQKIVHDAKHYRRLQSYRRYCSTSPVMQNRTIVEPNVRVLLDNGDIVGSYIRGRVFMRDGIGYVDCDGIPWPVPACRVFKIGEEPQ